MKSPTEEFAAPFPTELLRTYPGLTLLLDPEGRVHTWNHAGAAACGREPDALAGLDATELFKGPKKRAFRNRLDQARDRGEAEVTASLQTAEGTGPETNLRLIRVGPTDSGWVLMMAAGDPNTQEPQGSDAPGLCPDLMDALPYGVLVLEGQRLDYANPAATSLLGLDGAEELRGLMMDSLIYEPDHEPMGELLSQAAETGRADGRLRLLGRSDRPAEMEVSLALVGADPQPTLQLVFRPTTRQRGLERALQDSEERYRGLIGSLGEGFWMGDSRGGTVDVNQALLDMLGYSQDDLRDRPLPELTDGEDADDLRQHLNRLEEGEPRSFQIRLRHGDGRSIPVGVRMVTMPDPSTGISALFAFVNDLSDHYSLREHLRRETGINEAILGSLPGIFFLAGPDLGLTRWNTNLSRQTGHAALDLAGLPAPELFAPANRQPVRDLLKGATADDDHEIEAHLRGASGDEVPYRLSVAPVTVGERRFLAALGVDISDRKALEADLERMATVDGLTGAWTPAALEDRFTQELERTRRYGNPLSAVLLDLDRFQQVNDHYGRETGDQVLQGLGSLLAANKRAPDFLGRWGADRFLVLAPDTALAGARTMAGNLHDRIARHDFAPVVMVQTSMGVTAYHHGDTANTLLERLDQALHEAKDRGGNQVRVAEG
ncbi:sensor domain-containing diguanylate cyclase [Thiohalorhabdus sp.]|uniref:sensor domain-containing diguanylate cyclase n=1 Tax=Thiohalorhabdus sp. TaxID=3094134 RepID=UPI002FC38FED